MTTNLVDQPVGHVADPADRERPTVAQFLRAFARVGGLMATVALVMVVFAAASDGLFLYPDNLLGLLRYMSTIAIIGLGLTVVLVVGEIDLSFANLYGLSAMSMAVAWINWGWPLWVAILVALAVAVLVGAFNAFFTSVVGIPSFIATLGSSTLIFGFTLLFSGAQRFAPAAPPPGRTMDAGEVEFFRGLSNQSLPFGVPMQVLWMIVIALLFWLLLSRSLFGFRLKAIGGNPVAARFARLPVRRYKFWAFCIAGLSAAVAALLDFSFIGSIQPDAGQALLFPTFAAVVIGGASLQGGRGSVAGTLLGALLLAVIANGLALLAAGSFAQQMFLGVVTIGAVVLDQLTRNWRRDR
ncbi:ABC transporter permease [Micromonospora echinofusca]|uniref:ABC transporter permease n=1 Tax=Micromonospora echinofusca TaxID=47858 RepID=A0ABS3W046_MICEH|nr:ABC transporter permease [Micromonospora echinofusca]MBO4210164.1 ABC transporter permease [Micromonospora echinofusca]